MLEPQFTLDQAPIVEAVLDIDCDIPGPIDVDVMDAAAAAALEDRYPTRRRRMLSEHQISGTADGVGPLAVTSRQGLQALQYVSADEKQLIQFRTVGYSFNRLAPYSTLDEYLPEVERTWRIFVDIGKPVICRTVRLRYINRILLPMQDGRVNLDDFLKLAPRLVDEKRLTFASFFNQHSVLEPDTGNQANIVFATQPVEGDQLPVIFDIEVFKDVSSESSDWPTISGKIMSLRSLKNLVFAHSLTEKCLNLFRR